MLRTGARPKISQILQVFPRKEAAEKLEDAQQILVPVQREKEKEKEKETGPNDVQLPKHPGEDEAAAKPQTKETVSEADTAQASAKPEFSPTEWTDIKKCSMSAKGMNMPVNYGDFFLDRLGERPFGFAFPEEPHSEVSSQICPKPGQDAIPTTTKTTKSTTSTRDQTMPPRLEHKVYEIGPFVRKFDFVYCNTCLELEDATTSGSSDFIIKNIRYSSERYLPYDVVR
ncbi:hypothetical protein DUI87_02723 [Hirundo rustica rustica]|uniref:Uncharacterized protein n=1 Tax=Hirundo rustica rustica TaxID=333673 RepID=A0A3M0L8B8_HIRRU|nr:hypothetical protein DUI87_02723 [Hirundo rustica rustica]